MKFSDILGNEGVKQRLRQMVASDKIPHALLFEGPEGVGKLAMARAFAQYVHCQHPTADGEPCGECPLCLQYQTFNQPDTFFVFPIYKRKSGRDSYCDEFIEEWNEFLARNTYADFATWIKILDSDGRELPYGEKGEIVIRGENVMAGYWKNPKATAETVVDGWLHTGDMGYMRDSEMLYVVGRFKSLLISADGEKYSPEGIEESLVENSKYIDQVVLHNSQDPYTIALLVPNKDALKAYVKETAPQLDPASDDAKRLMLGRLQEEMDSYRKGGKNYGAFPERWLPAAVCVLPEPFTEQNHMVNSTMKIVRGKVEEAYKDRMAFAYTPEGKDIVNPQNLSSL